MTCNEFEELSGAYALGAVTTEERAEAQAHLARCSLCTDLYHELSSTVEILPLAATQMTPPAVLRARVMLSIRQEVAITAQRGQGVAAQRNQWSKRQGWTTRLLAVAATLLLALVGGMTAWNTSLQSQLATASPHVVATLHTDQTATGELFYLPQKNVTVLVIHKLPQLKGSQVYQGWLLVVHDKQTISTKSVGLLTIQGDTASVSFPGNATGYNMAAVSLEPGPAPSGSIPVGPVIATGKI